MIVVTPIRELQVGQWAVLEGAGLVLITGLEYFGDGIEIEFDGTQSPIPRHLDRPAYGIWSGLYDDFPFISVFVHREYHHG